MAEPLAWSLPPNDCVQLQDGYDGKLEIVYDEQKRTTRLRRADPRVTVTHEWLRRIPSELVTFDGDLLKVHTDDGSAVYRVDHHDWPRFVFLLSWPD